MKRRNHSPRLLASQMDAEVQLPNGKEERFNGYGVMGLTFDTGHVLALRRFGSSSVGLFGPIVGRFGQGCQTVVGRGS